MAFKNNDLSVLSYANGFTLWHYRSGGDALAAITAAGYFNEAADLLRVADMVVVEDSTNTVSLRRISASGGGSVSVAALA